MVVATSAIYFANSRVGAITTAKSVCLSSNRVCPRTNEMSINMIPKALFVNSALKIGRRKAKVLPDPV